MSVILVENLIHTVVLQVQELGQIIDTIKIEQMVPYMIKELPVDPIIWIYRHPRCQTFLPPYQIFLVPVPKMNDRRKMLGNLISGQSELLDLGVETCITPIRLMSIKFPMSNLKLTIFFIHSIVPIQTSLHILLQHRIRSRLQHRYLLIKNKNIQWKWIPVDLN